jgi:hypothetical protein
MNWLNRSSAYSMNPLASGKFLRKILFLEKNKYFLHQKSIFKFSKFFKYFFYFFSEFSEANKSFFKKFGKKCTHLIFFRLNEIYEQNQNLVL